MNILDYIVPKGLQTQTAKVKEVDFDPEKLGPKEVYMTWQAPGRVMHKGYNEKLLRTFAIIGVFVALFLVVIQEYFLILVVVSMIFVGQVLAKTPPEDAKFEFSSYGVKIDDHVYYWHELRRFFFFEQDGTPTLAIDLLNGFPARLFLILDASQHAKAREILEKRIQFVESVPETLLDKTYKSVTSKFVS